MSDLPMTLTDPYSLDALDEAYEKLCTQRDAIDAKVAPLRKKLEAAAADAEAERVRAMAVAGELDAAFAKELGVPAGKGKHEFIKLKNRLGVIAKMRQNLKDKAAGVK